MKFFCVVLLAGAVTLPAQEIREAPVKGTLSGIVSLPADLVTSVQVSNLDKDISTVRRDLAQAKKDLRRELVAAGRAAAAADAKASRALRRADEAHALATKAAGGKKRTSSSLFPVAWPWWVWAMAALVALLFVAALLALLAAMAAARGRRSSSAAVAPATEPAGPGNTALPGSGNATTFLLQMEFPVTLTGNVHVGKATARVAGPPRT